MDALSLGSGIGIGVVIGVLLGFAVSNPTLQTVTEIPVLKDIPALYSDDARLAELIATYFEERDGLVVAVMLHNADGEFTKANGHIELIIVNENGREVYSNGYDFTKDDFLTWDNIFLGKQRGFPITINERFPNGDYDVYANMETKSGRTWEGLHASFYSLE